MSKNQKKGTSDTKKADLPKDLPKDVVENQELVLDDTKKIGVEYPEYEEQSEREVLFSEDAMKKDTKIAELESKLLEKDIEILKQENKIAEMSDMISILKETVKGRDEEINTLKSKPNLVFENRRQKQELNALKEKVKAGLKSLEQILK